MKKTEVNLTVDAIMFLSMMFLAGTGFLRRFVLPGGIGAGYGGWGRASSFLGMDRHTWNDIHLWLGYTVLGLLAIHIVLHYKQIKAIYRGMFKNDFLRLIIAVLFLLISLAALFFPFL